MKKYLYKSSIIALCCAGLMSASMPSVAEIPEHAYGSKSSWLCKNGYKKERNPDRCELVYIPENASVAGEHVNCDPGYIKDGTECRAMTQAELMEYIDHLEANPKWVMYMWTLVDGVPAETTPATIEFGSEWACRSAAVKLSEHWKGVCTPMGGDGKDKRAPSVNVDVDVLGIIVK